MANVPLAYYANVVGLAPLCLQSVNNKPWEKAFAVSTFANGIFSESHTCNASPVADDPSCGWVIDHTGARVENSQVFVMYF